MSDISVQRRTMVDTQVRPSDVTKFPVIDAMLSVPREEFVPDGARGTAYCDGPINLGSGRVMLEPRTLAKMLDALNIQPNELVLDLGCGLGYSSAVISHLAEAVIAVEEDEDMVKEAEARLAAVNADNVAVIAAPLAEGGPRHGPYDVALLQGGVESLPHAITGQIKDGGRVAAIFIQGAMGSCRIGWKNGDSINWRSAFNAVAPILSGFARKEEFHL